MTNDGKLFKELDLYLAENVVDKTVARHAGVPEKRTSHKKTRLSEIYESPNVVYSPLSSFDELEKELEHLAPTFSEKLLALIDASGKTDAEIYKAADIDRKVFSKIRSNRTYHPQKKTALAFCIALELPLGEAKELLASAGYSLNESSRFDMTIQFCIRGKIFDLSEVNRALFHSTQTVLRPVSN